MNRPAWEIIGNHAPKALTDADVQRLRSSYLRSRNLVLSEVMRAKWADPDRPLWPIRETA